MRGIYALVISVNRDIAMNVGALHEVPFEKGLYVYVGSAQNNIEKRTARHLKKIKPKFWHIDYLLAADEVNVLKVFRKKAARPDECKVADELSKMGTVMEGFGSSDCACRGHLFKVGSCDFLNQWMEELQS